MTAVEKVLIKAATALKRARRHLSGEKRLLADETLKAVEEEAKVAGVGTPIDKERIIRWLLIVAEVVRTVRDHVDLP